jgi:hypothetical protein
MSKKLDLKDKVFGRLRVITEGENYVSPDGVSCSTWICLCECGNTVVARTSNLRNGRSLSCGCLKIEKIRQLKIIDLSGKIFGKLKVDNLYENRDGKIYWSCFCECGEKTVVLGSNLTSGKTKSCGCGELEHKMSFGRINFEDLSGRVFGKLHVEKIYRSFNEEIEWECVCECGNTTYVTTNRLKSGATKSCGCLRESFIASELKKYFFENYNAEKEKKLFKNPDTNQWFKCDVYIPYGENPDVNGFYIEINGEQHYQISGWTKKKSYNKNTTPEEEFEYQKYKDKIKKKYCNKNGYYVEVNLLKIKTVDEAINYVEKQIEKIIGEK